VLAALALAACVGPDSEVSPMANAQTDTLTVSSPAFEEGGAIPVQHSCDGADTSPPLTWSGAPPGTRAYVLIVHDPDAHGFVHWVAANIPAHTTELPEGVSGENAGQQGRNDFRRTGWGGPCPPSGTHRYVFTVYALSEPISVSTTPTADEVRQAMEDKIVGRGQLTGTFRREG
jgi:Raf kinase inhibitor-like YbhB/YbcL family protein